MWGVCVWGGDAEAVLQCTTRITRVLGEGLRFGVCGFFFLFLGGGGEGFLLASPGNFCVYCVVCL